VSAGCGRGGGGGSPEILLSDGGPAAGVLDEAAGIEAGCESDGRVGLGGNGCLRISRGGLKRCLRVSGGGGRNCLGAGVLTDTESVASSDPRDRLLARDPSLEAASTSYTDSFCEGGAVSGRAGGGLEGFGGGAVCTTDGSDCSDGSGCTLSCGGSSNVYSGACNSSTLSSDF